MGVLDTGERIYIHDGGWYCLHSLDDEHGCLEPAVDQIRSHKEAESDGE